MAVGEILSGTTFGDGDLDVFTDAGIESIRETLDCIETYRFTEMPKLSFMLRATTQEMSDERSHATFRNYLLCARKADIAMDTQGLSPAYCSLLILSGC